MKELVPRLQEIEKISEVNAEAEVFIGVKGLKSMFFTLFKGGTKKDIYTYFSPRPEEFSRAMQEIYLWLREYRVEKKIPTRGIHPTKHRGKFKKVKYTEERFIDSPLPPNMGIFRNRVAMVSWGEIPTGILIRSKEISEQYRKLFEEFWKLTKK